MANLEHLSPEVQTTIRQFLRYCVGGGSAAVIALITAYLCVKLGHIEYNVSQLLGFVAGSAWNYTLSRTWAFENRHPQISKQFLLFFALSLIGLGFNELALSISVGQLHLCMPLSMCIGLGTALLWNFWMHKFVTFRVMR